jgi:hypothetical protein
LLRQNSFTAVFPRRSKGKKPRGSRWIGTDGARCVHPGSGIRPGHPRLAVGLELTALGASTQQHRERKSFGYDANGVDTQRRLCSALLHATVTDLQKRPFRSSPDYRAIRHHFRVFRVYNGVVTHYTETTYDDTYCTLLTRKVGLGREAGTRRTSDSRWRRLRRPGEVRRDLAGEGGRRDKQSAVRWGGLWLAADHCAECAWALPGGWLVW